MISCYLLLFTIVGAVQLPMMDSNTVSTKRFANHALYTLNDGTVMPSPAFGAGSVNKGQDVSDIVSMALEVGYRHFDNARFYGNERSVGEALRKSKIGRNDLYITTKYDAIGGEDVETELRKQLKDLSVDYVDLYLIHGAFVLNVTGVTLAELWTQFENVQRQGLTKSIGVSNFNVDQLDELLTTAKVLPAVNQIKHHAYNALENKKVIDLGRKFGIVPAAYASLTPITNAPGGGADRVGTQIALSLSRQTGREITVGQAIADWLRTTQIVEVTTSGRKYRMREQLEVFSSDFPYLSQEQVYDYEHVRF